MEIISFFSFKGGVGRTALAANLGAHWAKSGKTVVLVDMDLAAPGLTFLPMAGDWLDSEARGLGLSDILEQHHLGQQKSVGNITLLPPSRLLRAMTDPDLPEDADGGRLLLIDAGSPRHSRPIDTPDDGMPGLIPDRKSAGDYSPSVQALRDLADAMREDLAEWRHPVTGKAIDYMLIDSRTGFAELVDLSLGFLADRMVLVSGLNTQNLRGLELTLKALHQRVGIDEFPAKVTVVLSPVPAAEGGVATSALEAAHTSIKAALRVGRAELPEAAPQVYHIHYSPSIAVDDRPLILHQPQSRYSREMRLIANWLDGTATPPWDYDAVSDDVLESVAKHFNLSRGRVSVVAKGKAAGTLTEPTVHSNPAADLPAWHWALAREQQSPEAWKRHLRDLVRVRSGVVIDAESFATTLAWAQPLPVSERQRILERLPKQRPEQVAETFTQIQDIRRQFIALADRTPAEALRMAYTGARDWATVVNRKPGTGLRRFLYSPVDGETLFPTWETWPEYWMMVSHDLLTMLGDVKRAMVAIDRAASAGSPESIAADLLTLVSEERLRPGMRDTMVEKARALAPNSTWVEFCILMTEKSPDRVRAREAALVLLENPPADPTQCVRFFGFLSNEFQDLVEKAGAIVDRIKGSEMPEPTRSLIEARYYLISEDLPKAEEAYSAIVQKWEYEAEGWVGLGMAKRRQFSSIAEAEDCLRRAIDLAPRSVDPWVRLAFVLTDIPSRLDEAEAAIRRATDMDRDNPNVWAALGIVLGAERHRYDEAEKAYRRAIDLDPKDSTVWLGLSIVLAMLGRDEEAERACERSIALAPESHAGYACLAGFQEQKRNCREALANWKRAADRSSRKEGSGCRGYAALAWRLGQHEAARAAMEKGLSLLHDKQSRHVILRFSCALLLGEDSVAEAIAPVIETFEDLIPGRSDVADALLLHTLTRGFDITEPLATALERTRSHNEALGTLSTLYDLAGWRPEFRERAREAARAFLDIPAEVVARFSDVPTPSAELAPYRRFVEGISTGAGDPADLPYLCEEVTSLQ